MVMVYSNVPVVSMMRCVVWLATTHSPSDGSGSMICALAMVTPALKLSVDVAGTGVASDAHG